MAFALKCFKFLHGLNNNCINGLNGISFTKLFSSVSKPCTISDVYSLEKLGQIRIEGWVIGLRKMKELLFLDITDGTCPKKLQITLDKSKAPRGLNFGASINASGLLQTNKNNQLEVLVEDIKILGDCDLANGYPFTQRMQYNPNHEREFIHLRPRTRSFSSLLRIRHKTQLILNSFLDSEGFFNVNVPVLTTNDCEGGGEVFNVKPDSNELISEMVKDGGGIKGSVEDVFFNEKTFLTVSGQLHLEAVCRALKKVYSFGPIFRAENSRSRLHLSEFYMLETEIAFINGITDITNMVEILIKNLIDKILSAHGDELQSYYKLTNVDCSQQLETLSRIVNKKFIILAYDEAFSILDKNGKKFKRLPKKGQSFGKEHELFIVKCCDNIPVFVVDWPAESKPFYMRTLSDNPDKVEAMDLLCMNVGELCGGGVREDNYSKLKEKIENSNFKSKLDWYLQLREFGNVTTGGFGMGYERFLQLLLNIPNIKDTIPFPRWPHNCKL